MTLITQQHNLAIKRQRQENKHKKACREKKGYPSMESALGDSCTQEGQSRAYKCGVCAQFHLARMTKEALCVTSSASLNKSETKDPCIKKAPQGCFVLNKQGFKLSPLLPVQAGHEHGVVVLNGLHQFSMQVTEFL